MEVHTLNFIAVAQQWMILKTEGEGGGEALGRFIDDFQPHGQQQKGKYGKYGR